MRRVVVSLSKTIICTRDGNNLMEKRATKIWKTTLPSCPAYILEFKWPNKVMETALCIREENVLKVNGSNDHEVRKTICALLKKIFHSRMRLK